MYKLILLPAFLIVSSNCFSQYHKVEHRKVSGNEIAVKTAGNYAQAGTTYVLTNDISSGTSTVFWERI